MPLTTLLLTLVLIAWLSLALHFILRGSLLGVAIVIAVAVTLWWGARHYGR
jgi:hypothetical protein